MVGRLADWLTEWMDGDADGSLAFLKFLLLKTSLSDSLFLTFAYYRVVSFHIVSSSIVCMVLAVCTTMLVVVSSVCILPSQPNCWMSLLGVLGLNYCFSILDNVDFVGVCGWVS